MFIRYSCGCVVLQLPETQSQYPIMIRCCDGEGGDHDYDFHQTTRDFSKKTSAPLTVLEAEKLVDDIRSLIDHGQRFRTIKSALAGTPF